MGEYSRVFPVPPGYWSGRLLRHGRGAAHAALSCAGAYVSGAAGSNECPAGAFRIETEAACRTAVTAAGKTFDFVETDPTWPRGCYYTIANVALFNAHAVGANAITNVAYFNAHAVGAGNSNAQLLCAAVTTGAPLTRRCATRVYCAVLAGGVPNNANGLSIATHAYICV